MNKEITESIERTKKGFEESFKVGHYYNMQTQDDKHLKSIMDFLQIKEGMKILDLGTGTGYLAFEIAEKHPQSEVVGLDIVQSILLENRKKAEEKGVENLSFLNYDGINFPFADSFFDLVVSRYALHHFPVIMDTFKEISRVLKHTGTLFLSDPAPNDNDKKRFVDAYMQMKKDGHIKFYTKEEWQDIGKTAGLFYIKGFETSISFPRKKDTALELTDIASSFDEEVIKGYHLKSIKDEIWITEKVNNLLLGKSMKITR